MKNIAEIRQSQAPHPEQGVIDVVVQGIMQMIVMHPFILKDIL